MINIYCFYEFWMVVYIIISDVKNNINELYYIFKLYQVNKIILIIFLTIIIKIGKL